MPNSNLATHPAPTDRGAGRLDLVQRISGALSDSGTAIARRAAFALPITVATIVVLVRLGVAGTAFAVLGVWIGLGIPAALAVARFIAPRAVHR